MNAERTGKQITALMTVMALMLIAAVQSFAWTKSADFESGVVGTLAKGASGFDYAGSATTYSSDKAASGTKSAKMAWAKGVEGFGIDHGEFNFPQAVSNGQEIWARGYFYFSSPWNWSCSPVIKVLRGIHLVTSSGANVGYLSVFADYNGNILLSNEIGDVQTNTGVKFDLDKWQSIEMYAKTSTSDPIFRIWKNGVLIIEDRTRPTMRSSTDYGDLAFIMTNWNGGSPQAQTQYVDNFIITTDRPSQVDSKGNPMIGPLGGSTTPATTPAPTGVRIISK